LSASSLPKGALQKTFSQVIPLFDKPLRDLTTVVRARFLHCIPSKMGMYKVSPRRAPDFGEHSAGILRDLGFSTTEADALTSGKLVTGEPRWQPSDLPGFAIFTDGA
jgi:hypothetical protein